MKRKPMRIAYVAVVIALVVGLVMIFDTDSVILSEINRIFGVNNSELSEEQFTQELEMIEQGISIGGEEDDYFIDDGSGIISPDDVPAPAEASEEPQKPRGPRGGSSGTNTSKPATSPASRPLSNPKYIVIPKLRVVAPVKETPIGKIIASAKTVSWYSASGKPGVPGTIALFAGHEKWGSYGSLKNIGKLKKGDEIIIRYADKRDKNATFIVTHVGQYPYADVPTFLPEEDSSQICLVTCSGRWNSKARTHSMRTIVVARMEIK